MELTDSGKFIEVEREGEIENAYLQNNTDNIEKNTDNKEKNTDNKDKTSTPNQSPAKSVRIKENGAKTNGDAETVKLFVFPFN